MTYITEVERYGRPETVVDLGRMAADLAAAFGGSVEAREGDCWGGVLLPSGVSLVLYGNRYGQKTRVTVTAHGPDAWRAFLGSYTGKRHNWPEISVDASRDAAKLAADIRRRVVDQTGEPLAALQADFDQWRDITDRTAQAAASLSRAWPVIQTTAKTDSPASRATWRVYEPGLSLNGEVSADGGLTFDRLSVGPEKARQILALLLGEPVA